MWPFRPSRGTAAAPDPSGPRTGLPAAQRDKIGRDGIGHGAAGLALEPTLPPLLLDDAEAVAVAVRAGIIDPEDD